MKQLNLSNMNWSNISLDKFEKIQKILEVQDEYTVLNLIDLIYDVDSSEMTINEVKKYSIEFLKEPVKTVKLKDEYEINGTVYNSNFNLTILTAAQFIDYQNYLKEENKDIAKILSVFFIPQGHKYNDGYDMAKVQKDIRTGLDIETVESAGFFFIRQLKIFAHHFQSSLIQSVKKMEMEKTQKKLLIKELELMDLVSLASFHSSFSTVK